MQLKSIRIQNYRSIEDLTFDIYPLEDGSTTYGLIGVNEAGKSSFLKAIALNEGLIKLEPKDYRDKRNPIVISYTFTNDKTDIENFDSKLIDDETRRLFQNVDLSEMTVSSRYNIDLSINEITIGFKKLAEGKGNQIFLVPKPLETWIFESIPKAVFWTAEEKYLISKPINLAQFAASPDTISIPLKNCFFLAGLNDISQEIKNTTDSSTDREELQTILGESVTEHIKKVWSQHPIKITFNISDGLINFHVKDENARSKAKTADQRSDGFRQFVSFLLTLSAEGRNEELKNTIILLDEPETHLHPKAQEDLLNELINLTRNDRKNIVFFATHSNYMVDKNILERNIKVEKPEDKTQISNFSKKLSTYASINYDAFDIASSDYHNELFGIVQEFSGIENGTTFDEFLKEQVENCPIKKGYHHTNGKIFDCTLPTYIRHLIHHPENPNNRRFTNEELRKSTKILLSLIRNIKPKEDE